MVRRSDGDLNQICTYISRADPEAALRVGQGIIDHVTILCSFPLIGPRYPRGSSGPTRQIVYGNYRIFYDVIEHQKEVHILHVRHGARDEPQLLG